MERDLAIKTPATDPDHDVIGRLWRGWDGVYFCDSYDPRIGFWMTNIADPADRRNVSERAPYGSFHDVRGAYRKAELREGMQFYAVDHAVAPYAVRQVSLEEARDVPVNVAVFADEHFARMAGHAMRVWATHKAEFQQKSAERDAPRG